jgi:hypothetical protein
MEGGDRVAENIKEKLDGLSEEIKKLREEKERLVREQVGLFNQKIDELKPIMDFVISNGYFFKAPVVNINISYTNGPILMLDDRKNVVLVYDSKSRTIRSVNHFSRQPVDTVHTFIAAYDVEEAFLSLQKLLSFSDEMIESLKNDCHKREDILNKFKS